MKILHINAVNKIRSTGKMIEEIKNNLNEYGVDSIIAYSVGPKDNESYKINNIFDAKVHALLSRVTGKQGYFSTGSTKKLIKYIQSINPDVINLHNLHSNYINLPMLLKFISDQNIPLVVTLHDCWFFTGKCTHYFEAKCYKWEKECHRCPLLKEDNKSFIFDRTKKMFLDKKNLFLSIKNLYVVGVSNWITNEAKKSPIFNNAKMISTIYNWVDTNKFFYKDLDDSEKIKFTGYEKIILGVATNWNKNKGIEEFINLAKKIKNDECIVLIGNIDENVKLPINIINIKETHDDKELIRYYQSADIFVNLSSQETFGKVTAEALACGLPAIVKSTTANPEIINESCGIILKNDQESSLINAINKIISKGKNYYINNCVNHVKNNFNLNSQVKKYHNFYEQIMEKEI